MKKPPYFEINLGMLSGTWRRSIKRAVKPRKKENGRRVEINFARVRNRSPFTYYVTVDERRFWDAPAADLVLVFQKLIDAEKNGE